MTIDKNVVYVQSVRRVLEFSIYVQKEKDDTNYMYLITYDMKLNVQTKPLLEDPEIKIYRSSL